MVGALQSRWTNGKAVANQPLKNLVARRELSGGHTIHIFKR